MESQTGATCELFFGFLSDFNPIWLYFQITVGDYLRVTFCRQFVNNHVNMRSIRVTPLPMGRRGWISSFV